MCELNSSESPSKVCILVVEDEHDIREALTDLLCDLGYPSVGVKNGLEGIEYLRSHPAPCLVLTDLMMPVMDGSQFRNQMLANQELSQIPVILISAADEARRIALQSSMEFLKKPVNFEKLCMLIEHHCPI